MSAGLSLLVFGQVYFLGPAANTSVPTGPNTYTINSTHIASIDRRMTTCDPESPYETRRRNYTYTPGVGAHKIYTQATTWNLARRACQEDGGHLAIINSVAESEVISNLMNNSSPHPGSIDSNYAFIGFHNLYDSEDYVTIHGKSLVVAGFNLWAAGEPTKERSIVEERCGSVFANGKLNDISCTLPYAYVCELS